MQARIWHSFLICSLLLGLFVSPATSSESFPSDTNDETFAAYLQTALAAGDAAMQSSSSVPSPPNLGAAILYAPMVPALEKAVAVAWDTLVAAMPSNCRPLIAIGVGSDQPSFSERSSFSRWPNVATNPNLALPCSNPRVLRAVVSTASRLRDVVPGFAALVIAMEPWLNDVHSSPVEVMRALSRPLCRGGLLLHLRVHEAVPRVGLSYATSYASTAAHAACSWDLSLPSSVTLHTNSSKSPERPTSSSASDSDEFAAVTFEVVFAGQRATAVAAPGVTTDAFHGSNVVFTRSQASRIQQRLGAFLDPSSSSASQLAAILEVAVKSSGNALLVAHDRSSSVGGGVGGKDGNDGNGGPFDGSLGVKWTRSAFQPPSLSVVAVDVREGVLSSNALSFGREGEEVWCLGDDTPAAMEWAKSAAAAELSQFSDDDSSDLQAQGVDEWSVWLPKYYRTVNGALAGGDYMIVKSGADPLIPKTAQRVLDVGCGAGATNVAWRQMQAAGRNVTIHGIEADPLAALAAADRLDRVWQGRIEDQIDHVPDHWYDTIVAADILEHLPQPDVTLAALRRKLVYRRSPFNQEQQLPWPHPVLVVSVPNLAFWPESLAKLLDGTWDYEDHGVLDRTHLRWFTAQSFAKLAKQAGFDTVASFTIGSTEEGASESFGEAYDALLLSLPPHQRVDLNARQFVFWLYPTEDFFATVDDEAEEGEGIHEARLAPKSDVEEVALASNPDITNEPSVSFPTEDSGPVIAIAIVTSFAVSAHRLSQVAHTWAAPNDLETLLPSSVWPPPQGFSSWMEVVAVSDRASACAGQNFSPPAWLKAAAKAAAISQFVDKSDRYYAREDYKEGQSEEDTHDGEERWCIPTVSCEQCDGSKSGIPCRSWCALRVVKAAFPYARWYLRLMDDTLVFPLNFIAALNALDFTQPIYAGDFAVLQPASSQDDQDFSNDVHSASIPFAFGGCGWVVSAPALDLLQAPGSQAIWHAIESAARGKGPPPSNNEEEEETYKHERRPGWSPMTPNLRLDSAVADDVLFGLLVYSVNHTNTMPTSSSSPRPLIRAVAIPGWSQAPVDVLGGVPQCPLPGESLSPSEEQVSLPWSEGNNKGNTTHVQELDLNGLPAGFIEVDHMCHRRVHDLGHWHNVRANLGGEETGAPISSPPRALALGNCRPNSDGQKGVNPVVFHMGDEVGGESKVWRDQLGEFNGKESRMGQLLKAAHAQAAETVKLRRGDKARSEIPLVTDGLDLSASFEGSPWWYWRLCATIHYASIQTFTLPGPTRETFMSAARVPKRQQAVTINDVAATLEIGLCDTPLEVVRRLCHSIASKTPGLAVEHLCDNSVVEALLRIAERLRDHARLHARPARIPIEMRPALVLENNDNNSSNNHDSPGNTLHWVTMPVGDDPVAAGQSFAASHGLSDDDADRIVTALKNELLPFDFESMCASERAILD